MTKPSEPWYSFLKEIDEKLDEKTAIHCIGGFAVAMRYGLERVTSDVDFIDCIPNENSDRLIEIAGIDSPLHKKHGLYFERVGVVTLPYGYEDRMREVFAGTLMYLSLWIPEQYDLALSKLERSLPHDIEDVMRIARSNEFDVDEFKRRYQEEFKVYVEDNPRHRKTFEFWEEMIEEEKSKS